MAYISVLIILQFTYIYFIKLLLICIESTCRQINHADNPNAIYCFLLLLLQFRFTDSKRVICNSHLSTLNTQWMSGMIGYHVVIFHPYQVMIHLSELWPLRCLSAFLSRHLLSHCALHDEHATPHRKSMKGSAEVAASGLTVRPSPCSFLLSLSLFKRKIRVSNSYHGFCSKLESRAAICDYFR